MEKHFIAQHSSKIIYLFHFKKWETFKIFYRVQDIYIEVTTQFISYKYWYLQQVGVHLLILILKIFNTIEKSYQTRARYSFIFFKYKGVRTHLACFFHPEKESQPTKLFYQLCLHSNEAFEAVIYILRRCRLEDCVDRKFLKETSYWN